MIDNIKISGYIHDRSEDTEDQLITVNPDPAKN